ncbi:MAG: GDP-mannose 4,6-dehydratase [Chromatiaceae bacterium]|nr:GDP-mannose 4,6-dehydratase [Chromatiaceae bacterium]
MTATVQKILLTGVAGFLGSHLLDRLLHAGHTVVGIDNLSMGRISNIRHNLASERFHFLQRDVTLNETFADIGGNFDCIVHLAAFKIPRYGKAIDTLRINYQGTDQVLQFAAEARCKCVVASTSDVYGRNPNVPFTEESECVIGSSKVARWAYAVSKLFDEHLALAYQESHGIPVTLLRFFGSYGPRQHLTWWGGPQSVFIDAALDGRAIPVHGDGLQTRSFTFVSDTVEGIYASTVNPAANGEILNLGSTHEITILDLAKMIHRLSGASGEPNIEFVPYESFTGKRYEDVRRRVPDVSLCERLLGVRAKVGLEEGLKRTIDWQREFTAIKEPA